jgi:FkbM family methyltransferase
MENMIDWKIPIGDLFYLKCKNDGILEKMGQFEFSVASRFIKNFRNVIDIGAHIGETAYRYSKYFKRVHAFEPVYGYELRQNIGNIENIDIYDFAVSDKEEEKIMIRSNKNSGATVIKTKQNSKELSSSRFSKEKINVKCVPIDKFKFKNIDFIKIDTEGYVLPVIQGMKNTLKNSNFLVMQIEMNHMTHNKQECIDYLKDLNFIQFDKTDVDYYFSKST